MATKFNHSPLSWAAQGIKPPTELASAGWESGYKPPAEYFNYKWNNDYNCINELQNVLKTHADNQSNPHGITKAQVGLGNVDNTADKDKPASTAVQAALNGKASTNHTHALDSTSVTGPLPLSKLSKGTDGYILTGKGTSNAPVWAAPAIKSLAGESVSTSKDTTVTAGTGATIVNDFRTRSYSTLGNPNSGNIASGNFSFAAGLASTASGDCSFTAGVNSTASGYYSFAVGNNAKAERRSSIALGEYTTASGNYSFAAGSGVKAEGECSAALGMHTIAKGYQFAIGKCNVESDGPTAIGDSTGDVFIVGIGTGINARSNALRISYDGNCYGKNSFKASGADFAEYFEWADGNGNNEDRRGLFVALDGEKIRVATSNDDVIGVVSATPTITGDTQSEVWKNMYKCDVFGQQLTETVEVAETTDENGNIVPAHTEVHFILNPDYDSKRKYVSRDLRAEWSAVGLVGKLVAVDDGTCEVNGYCIANNEGKATKSNNGYRVLARLDNNHIKILVR